MATSLLVGLGTGGAAILFTWMIHLMTSFYDVPGSSGFLCRRGFEAAA